MAWQGTPAGSGAFGQPPAFGAGGGGSGAVGFGQAAQPAGFAAFSQHQQQAQAAFGQPPGGGLAALQPHPQPAGRFGFGGMQQPPSPQPTSTSGFAALQQQQQQQQPAGGFNFGATQLPQQQPNGFGGFGGAQPQPQQPPGSGFGFGATQPQPTGGFAFGAAQPQQHPSSGVFGGAQQQASGGQAFGAAGQPASSFTFGQQAQTAGSPAPAQGGFPFGQQTAQAPSPAQFTFGRSQASAGKDDDTDEMDNAALAAAKAAALASMPKFGGASAAASVAPPPPPPKGRRSNAAVAAGLDAEEVARRAQRASRFGGLPVAPASGRESPAPQPAPQPRPPSAAAGWASREGSAAPEGDEEDDEGTGGMRSGAIVGTCEEMCPEVERERRSRLSDIQIFERPDLNNASLTSAELAVKRFARTIDDSNNAPEFFRTRGALSRTMAYLRALLDRQDARLGLIHKFLWDRYRSVRQDLYIQGMDDEFSVNIYEEVVRFHLLSEHELCEEEASITEMEGFNSHLNMEQMNKALISLNEMYNKLAASGRPAQHEAEFRAYHLLSLMGQHGKFKGDQQAFLSMLQAMRPDVRCSPAIQWVLKLQRAFASNNFVRFFALVRQAPYLLACLSHIYFGQVRGRALRTLGDTLAPKADTPVPLELSWLVEALMLDSLDQAQQLCSMHGFATSVQAGVPVVLLLKGAYVDPPPPVPRKRSGIISAMAPGARSLVVTTPGVPPLSAEEAAAMERQRQALLQRQREQEAQRAQQAAEQQRHQEAAAAAVAAEARRQQEQQEATRLAEEARLREQQQQQQQQAQLELQRQQQAALEEQRRRREEEARQQQQLAELRWQQEEQQRAAAEAERLRREAEEAERCRREAAEAAERQRLAELERQRLEELRRQEEERRMRREAKQRWAMQRFYFARWRAEARRRIEDRKRQERLAANLKACRVGGMAARKAPGSVASAVAQADEIAEGSGVPQWQANGKPPSTAPSAPAAPATKAAIDLAAVAAPLLLQRSLAAQSLYWKVLLAPPPVLHASSRLWGPEQQRLQHLHSWLALQLQRGRVLQAASGNAYVEGPLALRVGAADAAEVVAELATCMAVPDSSTQHCGSAALAGASGIILALPTSRAGHREVQQRLPLPSSMAARLPVLLVAATDAAAQHWREEIAASRLAFTGPVQVVSVEEGAPAAAWSSAAATARGSNGQPAVEPAAYSQQRLVEGLRWLAAHSPPQPVLKVVPVEAVARDALAAAMAPLRRSPALAAGGLAATQLLCAALQRALVLVEQVAEHSARSATAAWQWPPPEVAPPALRSWHDASTLHALRSALQGVQLDANMLLRITEDGSSQALSIALHMQLAALESASLSPLVLPPDVVQWFEEQLEAARAAPVPLLPHGRTAAIQQQQQQQVGSPSLRQKRKWQAGSPPLVGAAVEQPPAPRSWAAVVSGAAAERAGPAVQRSSGVSRLPYWQQLQEQLQAEKQQALGFRDHAMLAAAGAASSTAVQQLPVAADLSGNGSLMPAVSGQSPLLQALRQQAASERTATQRLLHLAQ